MTQWRYTTILYGALALLTVGCVEINGGAIETRWVINDATGTRIDCEEVGIAQVQLFLAPDDDPEGAAQDDLCPETQCRYDCQPQYGITPFAIVPARYVMWIRPRAVDSGEILTDAEGVYTPPRIRREVIEGEVTDLGVNLIVVDR